MTLHPKVTGIDVAKHHLDVFSAATAARARLANTPAALAAFTRQLPPDSLVVFEATGVYDMALRQALAQAGLASARVNPGQARAFARALGQSAKTDALDARLLALMGTCLPLRRAQAPDPARERLTRLHRRRDALVAMRAGEQARQPDALDPEICRCVERHIASLGEAIAAIETAIREHLAGHAQLTRAVDLLTRRRGSGRSRRAWWWRSCRNWANARPRASRPWSGWRPSTATPAGARASGVSRRDDGGCAGPSTWRRSPPPAATSSPSTGGCSPPANRASSPSSRSPASCSPSSTP